ncbi:hypothetical protein [Tabrizicola sp.]|uniref:hypothetical protein n=1 Tax=Tabrizicola sp. TaxID=2005166 RepID=UPI00286C3137|nr:hypothetical protein [Tabrizicola sp.]
MIAQPVGYEGQSRGAGRASSQCCLAGQGLFNPLIAAYSGQIRRDDPAPLNAKDA